MAYFPKGYFRRFCVGVDYQAPTILKTVRQLGTRKANKVQFYVLPQWSETLWKDFKEELDMATGMAKGVIACTLESHTIVDDYRSFPFWKHKWRPNCHVTFFPFSVFNNTLAHGARAVDAIKTFEEVVVLGNQSLETSQQVNSSLQEIMNRVSNLIVTSWSSALYGISGQSFKTNKLLSSSLLSSWKATADSRW